MSNTFTKPCWKKQFKLKHMLNTDEKCGTQLKIQMYEISQRPEVWVQSCFYITFLTDYKTEVEPEFIGLPTSFARKLQFTAH